MKDKQTSQTRRAGLTRLGLYSIALAAVSGWWLVHRAHADLGQRALSFGRELEMTTARQRQAGTTRVRVNGQEASLNSSMRAESVDAIMDRFEALCARESDVQAELSEAIARGVKLPKPQSFGVFRTERGQKEATAACFARANRGGIRALAADLSRALDRGDLGELGQFRYVFARANAKGSTHVLTVWSHGAMKLDEMFPDHGDAPGEDLAPGARPPGSVRVIAADDIGSSARVLIYESDREVKDAVAGYQHTLVEAGYRPVLEPQVTNALPVMFRVLRRENGDEVVILADRSGDKTLVTGLRTANTGYVTFKLDI